MGEPSEKGLKTHWCHRWTQGRSKISPRETRSFLTCWMKTYRASKRRTSRFWSHDGRRSGEENGDSRVKTRIENEFHKAYTVNRREISTYQTILAVRKKMKNPQNTTRDKSRIQRANWDDGTNHQSSPRTSIKNLNQCS
jgi:hypothetical protein